MHELLLFTPLPSSSILRSLFLFEPHHSPRQVPEGSRRKDYDESELVLYKHSLLVGQGKIEEGKRVVVVVRSSSKSSRSTCSVMFGVVGTHDISSLFWCTNEVSFLSLADCLHYHLVVQPRVMVKMIVAASYFSSPKLYLLQHQQQQLLLFLFLPCYHHGALLFFSFLLSFNIITSDRPGVVGGVQGLGGGQNGLWHCPRRGFAAPGEVRRSSGGVAVAAAGLLRGKLRGM